MVIESPYCSFHALLVYMYYFHNRTHVAVDLTTESESSPTASYNKPHRRRIHPSILEVVKKLESELHPYCTIHPYCTPQFLCEDPGTIVSVETPTQMPSTTDKMALEEANAIEDQKAPEEKEMVYGSVHISRTTVLQCEDMTSSCLEKAYAIVHELSTE